MQEEEIVVSNPETPSFETIQKEVSTVFQLEEVEPVEKSFEPIDEISLNDIEVDFKVVSKEEVQQDIVQKPSDSNPFDHSINESVNSVNEKRKEQLKKFNYTFKNNINRIEEMEKQPAYKRLGFDIDAEPEQSGTSQMSLDTDSNEDIQML